ncbi:MAG: hypothetical protein Kow0077_30750 [Anaerolineae bacterium]
MGETTQGRRVAAMVLIGLGAFFLLAQFGVLSFSVMGFLWPFLIILPGLAFLYPALRGSADVAPLAVPGTIITGTGVILLYQNTTGHWESWAYIWALYPALLGLGLMLMARRTGERKVYRTGRGILNWGLTAFLAMAAIFEIFIFDNLGIGRYALPVVLILMGVWMLRRGGRRRQTWDDAPLFTGAPVQGKRKHRMSASEELQRRINIALAEEDDLPLPEDE